MLGQMNASFRLRKRILIEGAVCAAFFLIVIVLYASLFFVADAKQFGFKNAQAAAAMAWIGTAIFGTMLLLSLWTIAAYFVEKFSLDGTTI